MALAPMLGGCPVFPASNVWNQRVDTLPVESDSAQLIGSIGLDSGVHADFGSGLYDGSSIGIPYVVVHGKTTPKSRVKFDYADESDKGPYPIPSNVPIEGYPHSGDGDRHALIVDRDTCKLYELYALRRSGSGWAAGSGAIWNLRSNALRPAGWTSADAAGLPILPGLARWNEVARRPDRPRAPLHGVADAQHLSSIRRRHDASSSTDPSLPPMGLRVRLKASVDTRQAAAAGADRRAGDEDLRADPGRQRLTLVRLGRAERALVERPAPRARCPARLRFRGRRHLEAAAVSGGSSTTNVAPAAAGSRRARRRPSPSRAA